MAKQGGNLDKYDCLEYMAKTCMSRHGGKPDAVDWKAMFAGVDADKIWDNKELLFNAVSSRVKAALQKQGVIHHG